MEDKKTITILGAVLIISIAINLFLFYAMVSLGDQYEDSCIEEVEEWCEMVNQGNEVINILVYQLQSYDEGYNIVPSIEMLECNLVNYLKIKN